MVESIDSVSSISVKDGWFTLIAIEDIARLTDGDDEPEVYEVRLPNGDRKTYVFESPDRFAGSTCSIEQHEELLRKAPALWKALL